MEALAITSGRPMPQRLERLHHRRRRWLGIQPFRAGFVGAHARIPKNTFTGEQLKNGRQLSWFSCAIAMLVCVTAFAQPVNAPVDSAESASVCRREIDAKRYDTMSDVCAREVQRTKEAGVAPGIKMALDVVMAYQLSESSMAWQQRLDAAQAGITPADKTRLAEINMKLGRAYLLEKKPELAIDPLTRALSFGPGLLSEEGRADTIASLADALLLSAQYQRAVELLESQTSPATVEMFPARRLSVRKSEAYLGLLTDTATSGSGMRGAWLQKRWAALEASVDEGLATRGTNATPYGELDCIYPAAERLPGHRISRSARGVAAVAFRVDSDGLLPETRLTQSSGNTKVDERALAMVKHAQCRPDPKITGKWMAKPFDFQ
ncbi:energy transducer TonB [Pandoraea sputorum]|uniref:energy transducer TonB n=1 Tax=Pandoraea sputorum TaxID=93222 RepID=UPI002F3FF15B